MVRDRCKRWLAQCRRSLLHGRRLPVLLGLLLTLLVLALFTSEQRQLVELRQRLDHLVYDLRFNAMLDPAPDNTQRIVIVDYDQRSLEVEGQWPWSRFKLGNLVTQLADYGALVVGFDVFFPEPERNLVQELEQRLDDEIVADELAPGFLATLDGYRELLDGDRYFAEAMQSTEVVLGFSFLPNDAVRNGVLPEPVFQLSADEGQRIPLPLMQGYTANVATLQAGARGGGFIDTLADVDGVVRRYPLVLRHENSVYPSLALDMARLFYVEDNFGLDMHTDPSGRYHGLAGVLIGNIRIPTDPRGNVLVPYAGLAGSFPYISATDVLRGTLSAEQEELLYNSLVLVGATATGLYDLRATPVQAVYPGVEVHANVLNALLSADPAIEIGGTGPDAVAAGAVPDALEQAFAASRLSPFPSRPGLEKGVVAVAIVLLGLALSLLYPLLGPAWLSLASAVLVALLVLVNFQLWDRYRLDVSLVILLLPIVLIAVLNLACGFLKEGLNRRLIKGMFDQYVPPAHIDAMLHDPGKYNFAGESKELTVLFADIRGFTSIAEQLSAVELKELLNAYLSPVTGIIFEQHGTIDKYVGDMVMAFWGAPLDDPEHRRHAVQAALQMLAQVEQLKPVFAARGWPALELGIGINTGMMNVGDMGSSYRRAYTVLGDAVNLGSRLEGITKIYGVKLLVGERTRDGLSGIVCRQVDRVQVKGKDEPVRIYEPLCLEQDCSAALRAELDDWQRAYQHYLGRDWEQADALLRALQQQAPDARLYALYRQRIASLREAGLPANWDGSHRFISK